MIQLITSKEIDPVKWNACVTNSKQGNIFGLYESISVACEQWIGVVLNEYDAVMALPVKKKFGFTYSWHPQFIGPLGIFGGEKNDHKEMLAAASKRSWWIKMYLYKSRKLKRFKVRERLYQVLSLKKNNIDLVRANYNDNTRRNIRKAEKLELKLVQSYDVDLVLKTFKENKGDQIDNIDEDSYRLLKKLMDHWVQTKNGYVTAVYQGEALLAIGYFLVWKNTVMYYKGAVTEEGKSVGAMHYLMDKEIGRYANTLKRFDFGGSNTSSVARFYKGFGGADRSYFEYEYKKFKIL